MRHPIDFLNKCTKYLHKLLGDIAILAICKYWSKHIFKIKYFDALQLCFELPTNAWGMWNCMICREFKYNKAGIRMEVVETWYFHI